VRAHEDLAAVLTAWGLSVRAHPWVMTGRDIAVMVSGNAMAHLYCELHRTIRPGWDALRARWASMVTQLLARASTDLVLLPLTRGQCEVHGRGRGMALVEGSADGGIAYRRVSGDPLALGEDLPPLDAVASWDRMRDTAYPDALVQILAIADAPRAGDIIVSATPGWDLRTRYEPLVHVSGHGALHRDQMMVPLVMSRAATGTPRRTVDVLPSVLTVLGHAVPAGLDGMSFR
jgi:hypothetical protein